MFITKTYWFCAGLLCGSYWRIVYCLWSNRVAASIDILAFVENQFAHCVVSLLTYPISIWRGGKLYLDAVKTWKEQVNRYAPPDEEAYQLQHKVACHRCGSLLVQGQKFYSGCSFSLVSCCPSCGAVVAFPYRFLWELRC